MDRKDKMDKAILFKGVKFVCVCCFFFFKQYEDCEGFK